MMVLVLCGGLSLFLLGIRLLSEAFQSLGSPFISLALAKMNGTSSSILAGMVTTFFIQSGLSTSLMASSFAASGLFSLNQLMAFLLGTNLGSVTTPILFALDVEYGFLTLIVLGIFPMLYAENNWSRALGKWGFALGIILLGIWVVKSIIPTSTTIMYSMSGVKSWYIYWPILTISGILSIVIRSSSSLVGLLTVMFSIGIVDFPMAALLVISINMGAAIPAVIDSWRASRRARYGNLYNLFINFVFGSLAYFTSSYWIENIEQVQLIKFFGATVGRYVDTSALLIPFFHLSFNLVLVVVGGLTLKLVRILIIEKLPKAKEKEVQKLVLMGQSLQASPTLGLELIFQEVKKMAAMIESLLLLTRELLESKDDQVLFEKILKYEQITDNINLEVTHFIALLTEVRLSPSQSIELVSRGRVVSELESIADYCRSIAVHVRELNTQELTENRGVWTQLGQFYDEVLNYYEEVFEYLTVVKAKDRDDMTSVDRDLSQSYLSILEQAHQEGVSPNVNSKIVEISIALNRICAHTENIEQRN